MFVYADESGHTGKHIFNDPKFYLQGAILSVDDPEHILAPIVDNLKSKHSLTKIHANELPQPLVEEIAFSLLEAIKNSNWVFHVTVIEKPYLSVTKFVDSIFDSAENKGARWLWYNHEFFRHSLCCFFDDLLPTEMKQQFWKAYLEDNYKSICSVLKFCLDQLNIIDTDARLKEVTKDGLTFAIENPNEITLMASQTKKSYKGHTPNMVAFISLLQSAHKFCKQNNTTPKVFVHDPQSEFGQSMREYHNLHSNVVVRGHKLGLPQSPERVEYGLGDFSLMASKDVGALQAVDIFLWLSQRMDKVQNGQICEILQNRIDPFYISRDMSELLRYKWIIEFSKKQLSQEEIKKGKETIRKLERIHFENLDKHKAKKPNE